MVEYERRRTEREQYVALRLLAKAHSFSAFASLVLGILAAAIVVAFSDEPGPAKLAGVLIFLLAGGLGFFHLRAQSQVIFMLFDIARNSRMSRELLEKAPTQ